MIVVRIVGGLGNQLFMYATGRALALRCKTELLLDTRSGASADSFFRRHFGLHDFTIEARHAVGNEIWYLPLLSSPTLGWITRQILKAMSDQLPWRSQSYLCERDPCMLDERLFQQRIGDTLYLDGYWQDERYFIDAEATVRSDLRLTQTHDADLSHLAQDIRSCNSVSVHARRLHQVPSTVNQPDPSVSSLPIEYYQWAIQRIASRVRNPTFYCFSDEPGWLQKHLECRYPVHFPVAGRSSEDGFGDFWLMRQCRHHILANSTFSWWSAWLADSPDKIVICPDLRKWNQITATPPSWEVAPP